MRTIALSQGYSAIVDDEDFDAVAAYKWSVKRAKRKNGNDVFYALRKVRHHDGSTTTILMHRFILGAISGEIVDHRDHDGLNNTRANLRKCTSAQNRFNTNWKARDLPTGVYRRHGKYAVEVKANGVRHYCGLHENSQAAAAIAKEVRKHLHGDFMVTEK